jgi:hypothetical protein
LEQGLTIKITWRVSSLPTGSYSWIYRRDWPKATYAGDRLAAHIVCSDEYVPALVKTGNHAPLTVIFYDYRKPNGNCPWSRRKLKKTFNTLTEAKTAFAEFVQKFPEVAGK